MSVGPRSGESRSARLGPLRAIREAPASDLRCRRRLVLAAGACCLSAACIRAAAADQLDRRARRPRELWITRPQAQESARAVYWADGRLEPEGYRVINRLYRDLHADAERPIELALLDLNYAQQAALRAEGIALPLILLSGFRTVATNRLVGGVEPSTHLTGQADDFVYEKLSLEQNFRLAQRFQIGGLGVYPDRGSLHKDVGAYRTWIEYGRPPAPVRINPERLLRWSSS